MSDQSDSQNREEEQIHMSEGTSPLALQMMAAEVLLAICPKMPPGQGRKEP